MEGLLRFASAKKKYGASEELVAASQESYVSNLESHRHGLATITDLIGAERDLMGARYTLVQSKAEFLISASELAHAIGRAKWRFKKCSTVLNSRSVTTNQVFSNGNSARYDSCIRRDRLRSGNRNRRGNFSGMAVVSHRGRSGQPLAEALVRCGRNGRMDDAPPAGLFVARSRNRLSLLANRLVAIINVVFKPTAKRSTHPAWVGALGRSLSGVLVLAALVLGLLVYHLFYSNPRTDDAYVQADTAAVAAHVSGQIVRLPIKDNQAVKNGDLLFVVDPRPYKLHSTTRERN